MIFGFQSSTTIRPQALEEGVEFKRRYNEKLAGFDRLALPDNGAFISSRGHREFTTNAAELRSPMFVADGI